MNVELLKNVEAHILGSPDSLDMFQWWTPNCTTVGCIAGWSCQLAGAPMTALETHNNPRLEFPQSVLGAVRAAQLLELSDEQAARLFLPECDEEGWDSDGEPICECQGVHWPMPFIKRYQRERLRDEPNARTLARITAERIEHFIATEGRE